MSTRGPASDDGEDASFLLDEAVYSGEENEVKEVQQVYGMVTGKVRDPVTYGLLSSYTCTARPFRSSWFCRGEERGEVLSSIC
jgi:hypothetical protein